MSGEAQWAEFHEKARSIVDRFFYMFGPVPDEKLWRLTLEQMIVSALRFEAERPRPISAAVTTPAISTSRTAGSAPAGSSTQGGTDPCGT